MDTEAGSGRRSNKVMRRRMRRENKWCKCYHRFRLETIVANEIYGFSAGLFRRLGWRSFCPIGTVHARDLPRPCPSPSCCTWYCSSRLPEVFADKARPYRQGPLVLSLYSGLNEARDTREAQGHPFCAVSLELPRLLRQPARLWFSSWFVASQPPNMLHGGIRLLWFSLPFLLWGQPSSLPRNRSHQALWAPRSLPFHQTHIILHIDDHQDTYRLLCLPFGRQRNHPRSDIHRAMWKHRRLPWGQPRSLPHTFYHWPMIWLPCLLGYQQRIRRRSSYHQATDACLYRVPCWPRNLPRNGLHYPKTPKPQILFRCVGNK